MRALSIGLEWAIRITGVAQLVLGLAFWTGNLATLIPAHRLNRLLFVVLLEAQAALAASAGASGRLVILSVAWGLFVPAFGMQQLQILPGEFHWIVQVAHLLVGGVAIALAERLARGAQALAEPNRVEILRLTRDAPRSVGEIAAHFDISLQRAWRETVNRTEGNRFLARDRTPLKDDWEIGCCGHA
jgi:hypothetical protein